MSRNPVRFVLLCLATLLSSFALAPAEAGSGWKNRPYVNLGGGSGFARYSVGGESEMALLVGSEAGFQYTQRDGPLEGRTRIAGQVAGVVGGWGVDTRVGSFLGVRRSLWGIEIGADLFRNDFTGKEVAFVESGGVDVPMRLKLGPKWFEAVGTITPAYLMDPERRAAVSPLLGDYAHELEVAVGLEIGLPIVGVSVTYRERLMSTGSIEGIYFGLEL
ncbi:MAG: hypothetical protein VXW32_00440 [Myxococcota bacterium]|nr:hypothetical protein [Myxococcota bacterium]